MSYPVWKKDLQYRGFHMIHEEGICWFPFGRESNSRLIPLCTSLESRLGMRRLPGVSPWIVFVAEYGAVGP